MEFFKKSKPGNNNILLFVVGIAAVFLGMNIGSFPLFGVLLSIIKNNPDLGEEDVDNFNSNPDFDIFGIDPNLGFLLLLLSFVAGFIALLLIFKVLHRREFKTLITPTNHIDFKRILFGFGMWLTIGIIMELVMMYTHPDSVSFNLNLKSFIPLVLVSLLILPIQTSLEELVFRSYLLQGIVNFTTDIVAILERTPFIRKFTQFIALMDSIVKEINRTIKTKHRIIIGWIITSVLFGAVHGSNPEIVQFGVVPMMFYYIGAGLFLGLLTIWDDRLELALGVHAATNFLGAVFMGYEGSAIQTDSLFKTKEINVIHMVIGFYICAFIFTLICKRKYAWAKYPINNNKELT